MREANIKRKTLETDIDLYINLDNDYKSLINTGIPFLDHMLISFAFNANIELNINAKGDLQVDDHHTVEDIGITLGMALKEALKDTKVNRYGTSYIPMDEALSRVVLDISNRIYLVYNVETTNPYIGNMTSTNFQEFFRALTNESRITLHIENIYGTNDHHIIESIFKAFGKALKDAIVPVENIQSTKGVL